MLNSIGMKMIPPESIWFRKIESTSFRVNANSVPGLNLFEILFESKKLFSGCDLNEIIQIEAGFVRSNSDWTGVTPADLDGIKSLALISKESLGSKVNWNGIIPNEVTSVNGLRRSKKFIPICVESIGITADSFGINLRLQFELKRNEL